MAQGDYFEIGVAYPLKNHKFREPTEVNTTFISQSSAVITVNSAYGDLVRRVQIGDSINLSNSSQGETVNVESMAINGSYTDITLASAPLYTYTFGDAVKIQGTKLAGGWELSGSSNTVRVSPLGIYPPGGGASDNFAQILRDGRTTNGIYQDLDSDSLLDFVNYRAGCMYKTDLSNSGGLTRVEMSVNDGSETIYSISDLDVGTYTQFSASSLFKKIGASPLLQFNLRKDNQNSAIFFEIDDVFLEHAKGIDYIGRIRFSEQFGTAPVWSIVLYDNIDSLVTNGDHVIIDDGTNFARGIVIGSNGTSLTVVITYGNSSGAIVQDSTLKVANSGYLQITEYADLGSISIQRLTNTGSTLLADNTKVLFNPRGGEKSERYAFSCTFSVFPQSLWDKLQKLLRYQDNGNLLAFHPYIDDLPSVMIGRLSIEEIRKGTPASQFLAYRDISFTFEECKL